MLSRLVATRGARMLVPRCHEDDDVAAAVTVMRCLSAQRDAAVQMCRQHSMLSALVRVWGTETEFGVSAFVILKDLVANAAVELAEGLVLNSNGSPRYTCAAESFPKVALSKGSGAFVILRFIEATAGSPISHHLLHAFYVAARSLSPSPLSLTPMAPVLLQLFRHNHDVATSSVVTTLVREIGGDRTILRETWGGDGSLLPNASQGLRSLAALPPSLMPNLRNKFQSVVTVAVETLATLAEESVQICRWLGDSPSSLATLQRLEQQDEQLRHNVRRTRVAVGRALGLTDTKREVIRSVVETLRGNEVMKGATDHMDFLHTLPTQPLTPPPPNAQEEGEGETRRRKRKGKAAARTVRPRR